MITDSLERSTLYFGLTELPLGDSKYDLGDGILLYSSHAKFLSPLMLVNTSDTAASTAGTKPAYWQIGGETSEITAELVIPAEAASSSKERFELARLIVFLIRLWTNPAVGLHVFSNHPLSSLTTLPSDIQPRIVPLETYPRHFRLGLIDNSKIQSSLAWVQENWKTAQHLYKTSAEFRFAADAMDSGQFVENSALTLVSLWGALEAIFSPSPSELKFRVSSLIASYLEPPGQTRIEVQKEIAVLYDKRSAAAHGKPRHEGNDLLKTFELLRKVIIKMLRRKAVPTKEELEQFLFGVVVR